MDLNVIKDFFEPYILIFERIESDATNIYFYKRLKTIYENKIDKYFRHFPGFAENFKTYYNFKWKTLMVKVYDENDKTIYYDPNINYELIKDLFLEEFRRTDIEDRIKWINILYIISRGEKCKALVNEKIFFTKYPILYHCEICCHPC